MRVAGIIRVQIQEADDSNGESTLPMCAPATGQVAVTSYGRCLEGSLDRASSSLKAATSQFTLASAVWRAFDTSNKEHVYAAYRQQ